MWRLIGILKPTIAPELDKQFFSRVLYFGENHAVRDPSLAKYIISQNTKLETSTKAPNGAFFQRIKTQKSKDQERRN